MLVDVGLKGEFSEANLLKNLLFRARSAGGDVRLMLVGGFGCQHVRMRAMLRRRGDD